MPDKDSKKMMDVSAPGKAAPSATSRPIIVNHGPMMEDPMMQKETAAEEPRSQLAMATAHKVLEPATLGSVQKKAEEKPEPKASEAKPSHSQVMGGAKPSATSEVASVAPPVETKPEPETKPAPEPEASEAQSSTSSEADSAAEAASESSSEAVVDAVANQTKDKKKEDEAAKAEEEKKSQLKQLIAEKKYFVPLSVSHHKKTNKVGIIVALALLVVAVAAAAVYQTGFISL